MKSFRTISLIAIALFSLPTISNAAVEEEATGNPKFSPLNIKRLDESWINPNFNPATYNTVAIELGEFDYRPGKTEPMRLSRHDNYTLPDQEKARMEEMVAEVFTEQLKQLKHYRFVDIADATKDTLVVHLRLEDVVNNVPDRLSLPYRIDSFVNEFGASTIALELKDHATNTRQFLGKVRDEVDVISNFGGLVQLERADLITARQRTKTHMRRWAKRISRGIDKMVVAAR